MLQRVKQIICVIMGLVLIVSMDVSAKENCTKHNVNVLWLDSYDNVYEMGMEAEMVIRGKVIKQTSESDQSTVITQNEIEDFIVMCIQEHNKKQMQKENLSR